MKRIAPGIWKVTHGTPEEFVATTFNQEKVKLDGLNRLSAAETPPFFAEAISFKTTRRGCLIELPLGQTEQIFGFGLHLQSFNATNTRKAMFVNDHQADDDGSSHAPVPFYVSTAGYGVLVDTLRNAKFYCGNLAPAGQGAVAFAQDQRKNTVRQVRNPPPTGQTDATRQASFNVRTNGHDLRPPGSRFYSLRR